MNRDQYDSKYQHHHADKGDRREEPQSRDYPTDDIHQVIARFLDDSEKHILGAN